MLWVSLAKKASRLLGRGINVYTDKEKRNYDQQLYWRQVDVTTADFSALAVLGFILGFILGIPIVSGIAIYVGVLQESTIQVGIIGGMIFGVILFMIFRQAPAFTLNALREETNQELINYLSFMKGCALSGISIEKAFEAGAKSKFGQLSKELEKVLSLDVMYMDMEKAMTQTISESNSAFFRKFMTYILTLYREGATFVPGLPPKEQPLAKAISSRTEEELSTFEAECLASPAKIAPILSTITVLVILLPTLIISFAMVSTTQVLSFMPPMQLKMFLNILVPIMIPVLVYMVSLMTPRPGKAAEAKEKEAGGG